MIFIKCFVSMISGCLLTVALGQNAGTSSDESILQKRYEAAQKFQAMQDLDHAAEQYRIFLADALGEVAIGSAQAGQFEKAQDDFDEALRLVPDFPMMQLEYARAAYQAGRLDRASLLAKGLLQRYPDNKKLQADAHALLGRILMKMDKNAEAKEQFEAAVDLDATFDNGYELAVTELNLGDVDSARKVFAEMRASFGDTAALHMYFGQAYGNSDFQSDAVAEFQNAVIRDAHLPGVHYSLAVAYLATAGESKLADAESELRKEIAISPQEAASYAALGHLLATHGQGSADEIQAEADLKHASELDPSNPDAFLYLGQLYASLKRLPEAEAALRTSIKLSQDVSRNSFQVQKAHYLLGRLLVQSGDQSAAETELAISQALMKQSLSRDQNRLSQYLEQKQSSGIGSEFSQPMQAMHEKHSDQTKVAAVQAFERRITPAIADSYNNLGAIAGSEKDYAAALIYFQRAAEWQPSLPGLDFNWGRAAYESGEYVEAIGPLSRHLQANPHEDEARRLLGLSQFMAKEYGAASVTLRPFADHPTETPTLKFAYADSLLETGRAQDAIPQLEALQKETHSQADVKSALEEAYTTLGRMQLAEGDARAAVVNLQNAVKLDPSNADLQRVLRDAMSKVGRN